MRGIDNMKLKTWAQAAEFCSKEYGSYINYEEKYFICPECGDPIYECDWETYYYFWNLCPVCEFNFVKGE